MKTNETMRYVRTEAESRRALRGAIYALNEHAYDCTLWDYADDGGCETCARLQSEVDRVHDALAIVRAKGGK